MDQSVITRAVTVAGGRFAPGHLGELTQQVPFEMADAVLEETCRAQRRVRDLPARVVVYLLLAGCLFAELGYPQVWHRLAAGLGGLPVAVPAASAMTQARRRLGPGPLRELFFLLRGPGPAGPVAGLLAVAIDGTIMTVADSGRTWPSTPSSAAGRPAGRAIRCCGFWSWSAAGPALSSTPCSAPSPRGKKVAVDGRLTVVAHEPRSGRELRLEACIEGVIDSAETERLTTLVGCSVVRG